MYEIFMKCVLMMGILWQTTTFLIESVVDIISNKKSNDITSLGDITSPLYLSYAVIIMPILEELLFRKFIQNYLLQSFGSNKSVILTSLLFTFCHFEYDDINLSFKILFFRYSKLYVASLTHGMQLNRTKSIFVPIFSHALNNYLCIYSTKYPIVKILLVLHIVSNSINTLLFNFLSIEEKFYDILRTFTNFLFYSY